MKVKIFFTICMSAVIFSASTMYASLETGQRYLKLSYSYLTAENPVKAEQAIDKAYEHIFSQRGNDYWKGAAYEYAGYILYYQNKTEEALKYFYKAYEMYLTCDDVLDGSDDALFRLIQDRYPGESDKLINEFVHNNKREWKVKNIFKKNSLSKLEECKRKIKLSNTYFNLFTSSGIQDDLVMAKANIFEAEELAMKINNAYWMAAVNETLSYIEFSAGDITDAQARLKMAFDVYMGLIKSTLGSDDAVYAIMEKYSPENAIIRKEDINLKSWVKLERTLKKSPVRRRVRPPEEPVDPVINDDTSGK